MSYAEVRQLGAKDWPIYKEIRLRSLQDSPDSYASSYEREAAFTDEQWQERLSARGPASVFLLAELDSTVIGLVSGLLPAASEAFGNIFQMWVDPEYRGKGVGKLLLARIIHWAMSAKAAGLELGVTTSNIEAMGLYELAGFKRVGELAPLRESSELSTATMRLEFNESAE
ncbi:MAG: GNAT family N-acetyltransferase [Pseudohongiellaceae bacterium]|nr:GNAT family N-acetyltransferase [Pseudohongiellaceae bacterium]